MRIENDRDYKNEHFYSEHFSCPKCDISFEELQPRAFSFNSPFGACNICDGLGTKVLDVLDEVEGKAVIWAHFPTSEPFFIAKYFSNRSKSSAIRSALKNCVYMAGAWRLSKLFRTSLKLK